MRWRWISISVSATALALILVGSVQEIRMPAGPYNVLLLTVESTRADAIGPQTTPRLWQIAQEGRRFTQHRAASAWTAANVVTLLTGLPAFDHGVHTRDRSLPADLPRPLRQLSEGGWAVGGVQPFMLTENFHDLGLTIAGSSTPFAWMAANALADRPFFLWHHYLDTHLPYQAAPGSTGADAPPLPPRLAALQERPAIRAAEFTYGAEDIPIIRAMYDAQYGTFDDWFGTLWSFLERSGLRESTIVVLTADHGEELGERGAVGHASTTAAGHLHEEVVRLPLILWLPPGLADSGTITSSPTGIDDGLSSHVDILPTLFARLGMVSATPFTGVDLFGPTRTAYWEGITSEAGFVEPDPDRIRTFIGARLEGDWKLHLQLRDGAVAERALYDLSKDPEEREDRLSAAPDIAERLTRALLPRILEARRAPGRAATPAVAALAPPQWMFPASSGTLSFADLPSPLVLRWTGPPDADYRLQYQAGQGPLAFSGEVAADGPQKAFGRISQSYWREYIVPYKVFRLRVGVAGRDDLWSPWVELEIGE